MSKNLLMRLLSRGPAEVSRFSISDYLRALTNQRYGLIPTYAPAVTYARGQPSERVENSFTGYIYGAYKQSPIVFAVMAKRASIFSEARFLWRHLDDGRPGDLFNNDDLDVLRRPWPNGTTGELLTRMIQDVDLSGNFYAVNEGDRLRRLRPDWVQIVLSGDPRLEADIDVMGYTYSPGGPDNPSLETYLPDQICHWSPQPDPDALYRGMSWLTPIVREIQGDLAAVDHKLAFFNNGATLGPIVRAPEAMSIDKFREFVEAADAAHVGVNNAYKTMYIGGGADVTLSAATMQQLDFSTLQGHAETRICVAGQVPAVIAGVSEGLQGSSLNAGNYQSAKRAFVDSTLRTLWRSACASLATILTVPADAELWFDEADIAFLREDQSDAAAIQQTQMATIVSGIQGGFEPDSLVTIINPAWKGLKHTGLTSVQLVPPGTPGEPSVPGGPPTEPTDTPGGASKDPAGGAVSEQARAITALAKALSIERGHPHPGQHYKHGWIPIAPVADLLSQADIDRDYGETLDQVAFMPDGRVVAHAGDNVTVQFHSGIGDKSHVWAAPDTRTADRWGQRITDALRPDAEPSVEDGLYVGRDSGGEVQVRWVGEASHAIDPADYEGPDLTPGEAKDMGQALRDMAYIAEDYAAHEHDAASDVPDEPDTPGLPDEPDHMRSRYTYGGAAIRRGHRHPGQDRANAADDLDDDLVRAVLDALNEDDDQDDELARALWNPNLHPRDKNGRFLHLGPRMTDAVDQWARNGFHGDPLDSFNRTQLLSVAKQRNIPVPAGLVTPVLRSRLVSDIYLEDVAPLLPSSTQALPNAPQHPSVPNAPNVPTAPTRAAPRVTSTRWSGGRTFSSRPGSASYSVFAGGANIGDVHRSGPSGSWTAFPPTGAAWGLQGTPGSGRTFPTKAEAMKELADAYDAHQAVMAQVASLRAAAALPIVSPAAASLAAAAKVRKSSVNVPIGQVYNATVKANGVDLGWIQQDAHGTWTAVTKFHGIRSTHSTRTEAINALAVAHLARVAPSPPPVGHTPTHIPGLTTRDAPGASFYPRLIVSYHGADIGRAEEMAGGWMARDSAGLQVGGRLFRSQHDALQAVLDEHLATQLRPGFSATALPGVSTRQLPHVNNFVAQTVDYRGSDIGQVYESHLGWQAFDGTGQVLGNGFATRDEALKAVLDEHLIATGQKVATPPAPPTPHVPAGPSPSVKAAQDILYGLDPKGKTTTRQLEVYGALKRNHFDALNSNEQSTLLGDLAYIAATSKSTSTQDRAKKLIDRFTPAGTPSGTIPTQSVTVPTGAGSGQMRIADPAGTLGLLKMRPAASRGKSGDGWTQKKGGGTGPWGQYGAAGLMLRHVDAAGVERFLMVERGPRISDPGKWQYPGGAKEELESFYEGAAREVVEELGFKPTDLDSAAVHGTHTFEVPDVSVPGLRGGTVPWAYVSIAATVPDQLIPDLSSHHARAETSDAKWMTAAEIADLDTQGKLMRPIAGGAINRNVLSLFPPASTTSAAVAAATRPARLTGAPSVPKTAHKPSTGKDLVGDRAAQDKLRADVAAVRKDYRGKTADERLAAIGAMQGYDATPTVVSKSEMDRLLATGEYIEAWRGVEATNRSWRSTTTGPSKSAAQVAEDMRSGVAFYGTGIFGNGYYLATAKDIAKNYSDGTKNSLIRVLIPRAANIDTYENVHTRARQTSSSVGSWRYVGRQSMGGGTLHDEGRYAAAAGLDGIKISHRSQGPGGGNSHAARPGHPTYNWVNRSVLIIQEADK